MTRFMSNGGVSRRGVLKGATAIGAAALVTPWGTPLRAQPTRGGTLRVAISTGGTTDSLDPRIVGFGVHELSRPIRGTGS